MPKRGRQRGQRGTTSNTYRFFVTPDAIRGDAVQCTDPALLHQWTNVLRLEPGTTLALLDNTGSEYQVVIDALDRRALHGTVVGRRLVPAPRLDLTLYIAVLKGERFEWVLQKATELGVNAFVPITTEHSIVDDPATVGAAKTERWERIIREAAEQSRRGRIPRLDPVQSFEEACQRASSHACALLLWEGETTTSLRQALRDTPPDAPSTLALFSGPEGGWSADELLAATEYNISSVTLGPRILRAETAPIAAISAAMYEHGDLG
jgi:16S rRNA (uracil1498-N3)-methyltransferase